MVRGALLGLGAVGLFVAGLGIGAWLADRPADAPVTPVRTIAKAKDPSAGSVPLPKMTAPSPAGSRAAVPSGQASDSPKRAAADPGSTTGSQGTSAPVVSARPSDDLPAWRRHAVPVDAPAGAPMIAIVLDDLGIDRRRSARAVALPAPLTLAYLPYADNLGEQTAAARAGGHELLLHMPMQPHGHNSDPGPNVLDMRLGAQAVADRLAWNLARFEGYVGINNHMGSLFTESSDGMRIVSDVLRKRGLMLLDSLTSPNSVALEVASGLGVAATARDVFLDNTDTAAEVVLRLAQTERVARQTGTAIAIGHPRDATLNVLAVWIGKARDAGFVLVPLTTVLQERRSGIRQQASRQ